VPASYVNARERYAVLAGWLGSGVPFTIAPVACAASELVAMRLVGPAPAGSNTRK
jgi:hypothetical protein